MTQKKEWLLKRQATLSASIIAPVLSHFANELADNMIIDYSFASNLINQNLYDSCYTIWLEKQMDKETYFEWQAKNSNKYTQRGNDLESEIFKRFLNLSPEYAISEIKEQLQIMEDVKNEKGETLGVISATLDYHLGDTVLECKSTNEARWLYTYHETAPLTWQLQLQMQMYLAKVNKGFIAVSIGNDEKSGFVEKEFKIFEIQKNEMMQNAILESCKRFFIEFAEKSPAKKGIKKESEIEAFLQKKQESIRLEVASENNLEERLTRKRELLEEIEITKKYLAELEIESKEINANIALLANLQKEIGGQVIIYDKENHIATLQYRKDKDSLYTAKDIEEMKIIKEGDLKRKGAIKEIFKFNNNI